MRVGRCSLPDEEAGGVEGQLELWGGAHQHRAEGLLLLPPPELEVEWGGTGGLLEGEGQAGAPPPQVHGLPVAQVVHLNSGHQSCVGGGETTD